MRPTPTPSKLGTLIMLLATACAPTGAVLDAAPTTADAHSADAAGPDAVPDAVEPLADASEAPDAQGSDLGRPDAEGGDAGQPVPAGWPEGLALIELDERGHALVEGNFSTGAPMEDLAWARAPGVGCWDNPISDEFYSQNHVLFAFAEPLEGWHDVQVTVTPGAGRAETNAYLLLQRPRDFSLPPETEDALCHHNLRAGGPGAPVSFEFRIHDAARSNALLAVANRGRWPLDDSADFTIEVQVTPVANRCYAPLPETYRWTPDVRRLELDEGRALAQGNLSEGFPMCSLDFLETQFCAPSIRFEYFDGPHVMFALDEPLPAETLATVTVTPEPGVDVNIYGGDQSPGGFSVPPDYRVATCEASLLPRPPLVEGSPRTNPGEPESFLVITGNGPKNLFFVVAGPAGENGSGAFSVSVETIDLRTDLCEERDYAAVTALQRWPDEVEIIDIVDQRGQAQGDTRQGEPPLCSLDWAASGQTACFPLTERRHFGGNVQYFAIDEAPPAGSNVDITVTPAPGVDVNVVGYRLGLENHVMPPLVPVVSACESSYPQNFDDAPEPGVPDTISFRSIRNPYRYFIMVAARGDNELGGAYTVDVEVTEPPPPHCPESLPGARYADWPAFVERIPLNAEGRGEASGDLAEGRCMNLDFATSGQVACFPTTRFHFYEGNHVFYALDEPIPPRSSVEITVTPTDGGEISI